MPLTLPQLPANPFDDNIVSEPRKAESSIAGLNDHSLSVLAVQFESLEKEPLPRRSRHDLKAQLVLSPEPGYGKSHLIGRLFRTLSRRATRIYLRPFHDAASSWLSILLKLVQELHRPDDPGLLGNVPGEVTLTQLDAFAHGVLAHLLASLIEKKRAVCDDPAQWTKALRQDPVAAFGHGQSDHYLAAWVRAQFATELLVPLQRELQESGVELSARPKTWLKVLFSYAYGETFQRSACLEWLKGEGMSDEEAAGLGLEPHENPAVEDSAASRNEAARRRLFDLLALAGFYRPFLLCFDQTEMMTGKPEVSAEFGRVVEDLFHLGLNHMLVVTANSAPWKSILESMEITYWDRFASPTVLTGINPAQAEKLVKNRLEGCDVLPKEIVRFLDQAWLDKQFEGKGTDSVRHFLRQCSSRCEELSKKPDTRRETTLEDCFQHYLHEVVIKPGRLEFDPEVLRWSVSPECVGQSVAGTAVEVYKDQKGYFPVSWKGQEGGTLLWGMEDSSNWKRWEAILREAERQVQNASHQKRKLGVIFLRTQEQPLVPAESWKVLKPRMLAAREWFTAKVISREALIQVAAAYEMFASSMEGNLPFPHEAVLACVRAKLAPWWAGLFKAGPADRKAVPPPSPEDGLLAAIRQVLSTQLFVSLDQLAAALANKWPQESLLAGCQALPQVKIFSTAQATALQWKSSP